MRRVRLAFRAIARTPIVSTIAIISLAFGIGANAAVYSMAQQLILGDIPTVPNAGQLVRFESPGPRPGTGNCGDSGPCEYTFSYPMLKSLEAQQTVFTGIAAHALVDANIVYGNSTERGQGILVNGAYFNVLGVTPQIGRLLGPDDDKVPGGSAVAVLSYAYWKEQLGADSGVLNKQVTVHGVPFTIVGVTRPGFNGVTVTQRPLVFVPLTMDWAITPDDRAEYQLHTHNWLYLFARLNPGVSMAQAEASMNAKFHALVNDEIPLQKDVGSATLAQFKARPLVLKPGRSGQSEVQIEAQAPLLMLLATTFTVLLIVCANIANLLLARAADRTTELAVRLSLGATRAQLMRQLLTETLLLAAIGGAASVVVARATLALVTAFTTSAQLSFTLQPAALGVTALLALGTAVLFGVFPALQGTRFNLDAVLRAGSGKLSGARSASRFRNSLATAQIGLSAALLVMAGVFVRSLNKLSHADLGANVANVVTFSVNPGMSGYDPARSSALLQRIEENLATLPGVTHASASMVEMLGGYQRTRGINVTGFTTDPDADRSSRYNRVGPDYFKAIGTQMVDGREFSDADSKGAPLVAIVNETFVRKFSPGSSVLGKYMSTRESDPMNIRIVGVVKDVKYAYAKRAAPPQYYLPIRQDSTIDGAYYYARAGGDPALIFAAVRKMMAGIDPALPVTDLKTIPMQLDENIYVDRMMGTLSAVFAGLATLLACVGLYGVLAYSVAQRSREFGIRMALGADRGNVGGLVLRQVARMELIGAPLGIIGAVVLARAAKSQLYEMDGVDPTVMAWSVALLAVVALAAALVPALRASRVQPVTAMRAE